MEVMAGVDGIHFGAIVLDGQVIMEDLVDTEDLADSDMILFGRVLLDTTLSGVAVLEDLDTTHSGAVSEGMEDLDMVDLEDGADGTLTTLDTGIHTDQFIMVVA
jgi:hypothetical protein